MLQGGQNRWSRPQELIYGSGAALPFLLHPHGKQRLLLLLLLLTHIPVRLSRGDAVAHAERRQSA